MTSFPRFLFLQLTTRPKPLPQDVDLSRQTALVTGSNGGLGLEVAKDLAGRNAGRVILCARNARNEADLRQQITAINPTCLVELWPVDYEDYGSLLAFGRRASALDRLDIVVLNAGVRHLEFAASPRTGHERNVQVNHLGTALLSLLLLPKLQSTARQQSRASRLTLVSSMVHFWTPFSEANAPRILARMDEEESMRGEHARPEHRYATSKLLNVLWTRALASRVDATDVIINCVDPGLCSSNLLRHETRTPINVIAYLVGWSAAGGGHNIANAAVAQKQDSHGAYVSSEQAVTNPSGFVISESGKEAQDRVWDETIELFQQEVPDFSLSALID